MRFFNYTLIDQKICQLAGAIETNLLTYINPQNLGEQKKKFFESLNKNEQYNPVFTYASRNPLYTYFDMNPNFKIYQNELKELIKDLGEDSLGIIFEKKIIDLFERMELVRSVGTENFAGNSESYYGTVDPQTLRRAKELLSKEIVLEEKKIHFDEAKKVIEAFLKKKKLNYKVKQRETENGAKFSVNIRTKEIFINKDVFFSENTLRRLIAHEIEGHVYRYENGLLQPYGIFSRGLSKETLETEEGLAVYIEQQQKINIDAQLKEYAGRVMAITTASKKSFFETFEEMNKYFSQEDSFTLALRAKRGTWKQDVGSAFTKDALYLKGLLLVEDFLKDQKVETLYHGRYSINDTPLALDIAGLVKPAHLPECLKKESART
ncbi:MAG: tyrosine/phenylalanine carboxypeptidase domain-containing protein [archaeon]|jgi:hypothetical protein